MAAREASPTAWCERCGEVAPIVKPWKYHKVVARTVYVIAGTTLVIAPYVAFDYCVLTPFAMSILIAIGPARRLAALTPICRQCGGRIEGTDGRSGVFTAKDRAVVLKKQRKAEAPRFDVDASARSPVGSIAR